MNGEESMAVSKKTSLAGVRTTFQNKMNAYKVLCNQTMGGKSGHSPTPTQLKTFSKWVDKGAIIQNVSNTQLNRWAGKTKNWTVGTAKTTLCNKFGKTTIKAVAYNKSGGYIVATSPVKSGKVFKLR